MVFWKGEIIGEIGYYSHGNMEGTEKDIDEAI